ncbi:MAG: hypothetical protein GPJ54_22350 [Candidatus Heimdallarchaeota archaeon]|nr:hypothetical protein [Candidatus Heimdallarchaeota archaeon]
MDNEDSSKKENASDTSSSLKNKKPINSDDLSKRISNFGNKVNAFIEELRSTGETVFASDTKKTKIVENHDDIVESLLEGHIDDDLNLIDNKIEEHLENQILELTNKITELNEENSKLKQEIVNLQLEIHTVAKHADNSETLTVDNIQTEENVHEIKEVNILNYYNPEHWDRLIQLNNEDKLTLRILEILQAEEKLQLIILALMLEADPSDILGVMRNLQDIGVVDLGYKTKGGLNPMITLIKHF